MHAWAENAVVVSDDGRQVKYHVRCPYCGKVNNMSTSSAYVGSGVTNCHGSCGNCFKNFPIKLGGN